MKRPKDFAPQAEPEPVVEQVVTPEVTEPVKADEPKPEPKVEDVVQPAAPALSKQTQLEMQRGAELLRSRNR